VFRGDTNHGVDPAVAPYYGEISYSGRNVAMGYYKAGFSDFVKRYGNEALYGGKLAQIHFK